MRLRIPLAFAAVLLPWFIGTGCVRTEQNALQPVFHTDKFAGLPADIVEVQVYDLRPGAVADDGLPDLLRSQVVAVLGEEPAAQSRHRYRLSIDIVEHRSFCTTGNRHGCTRLRLKLLAGTGALLRRWDLLGSAERPEENSTEETVTYDSYNLAVAELIATLSRVSLTQQQLP